MSGSEWQIINMKILRKLSKIAAFSNWLLVSAPDWLRGESLWRHCTVNLKTWHSIFHSWRHLKCLNIWSLQLEGILYLKTSSSSSKSSHWLLQESSRLQDFIKTSNLHDVFLVLLGWIPRAQLFRGKCRFRGNFKNWKILGIEPIHSSWRFVITLPRGFNRYFLYQTSGHNLYFQSDKSASYTQPESNI